ncbi:hypothetical protein ACQ4PT_026407 [Festuca glaucescens]
MEVESRGPESNPIRRGAVSEDDPAKSPPRPPSDQGSPFASPVRRGKEETSESDSGSARRRKRKRFTEPRVLPARDSASSGSDSSAYSSPLREPKAPVVTLTDEDGTVSYVFTDDKAAVDKYYNDVEKYDAKMDGKVINQCTGIVVEVDAVKKSAAILTSAWIICTKKPRDDWTSKAYDPKTKVNVHMLDGSVLECRLMYFSKHYEIAYFEIPQASQLQTLSLEPNMEFDQDVFLLARDTDLNLIYKRDKCGTGGALLDLSGKIVGMLFYTLPLVAFIPSSLILKCSIMWQRFGQLARPQLGLKLGTLGFLGIPRVEFMSRNFNISSGLIVGEISAKCDAEKLGIRAGDVIFSCQKKHVSSIIQLEDVLLGVGAEHLEKSNDLSSKVDVEIGVFHVRKRKKSDIILRVELSDCLEVFQSDDEDAKAVGSKGEEAPASAAGEAKP